MRRQFAGCPGQTIYPRRAGRAYTAPPADYKPPHDTQADAQRSMETHDQPAAFCLLLLACAWLSGCASPGYFQPTPIATPGNAMVYLYRPAASNPGAKPCTSAIPRS